MCQYNAQISTLLKRPLFSSPSPNLRYGSVSEQLAHLITTPIIARSTVLLDIHAGNASEDLTDFICYYDNKKVRSSRLPKLGVWPKAQISLIVVYPVNLNKTEPAEYAFEHATQQGNHCTRYRSR